MDSLSASEVRDAGLVIAFARRIESRMTELGAKEAGLHDKTDFLAPKLTPETVKKLHFIGAVRNRAAHEDCRFTPEEINGYTEACNQVLTELSLLGTAQVAEVSMPDLDVPEPPPKRTPKREAAPSANPPPPAAPPAPPLLGFWDLCALIPEAHVIYLGMVLLRNCAEILDDLFALLFGLLALYFIAAGAMTHQTAGIWFGAALLVLVYLFACFRAQSGKLCEKLPKVWKYLPVLNGVVFLLRAAESFHYVETAFALLGLGSILFGTLLWPDDWKLGAGLCLGSYVCSIILWIIGRFRRD